MYPTTTNLTQSPSPYPWLTELSVGELVAWCLPCGFAATAAIFGNTLVLASFFMSSNLRHHVSFFVAGLAVADVLVGLISIPMWMYILYLAWKGNNTGNATINVIYDFLDVFAALNSIFHLTAISIERFFATIYPWRHRRATQRMYHVFLLGIWLASALVSSSFFLPVSKLTIDFRFYLINILFVIPLLIMSVAYTRIWFKAKTRLSRKAPDTTLKISLTLFIVISLFIVAWLPFFVVRAVLHFCKHYCVSWRLFYFTKLLHFSNSAVNPLVYGLRIPEYRETFFKLLGLKYMIPARDSIELDSLAVKSSPRSFGGCANSFVNAHRNNHKVTRPAEDNWARRASSLPAITISTASGTVTRSKSF